MAILEMCVLLFHTAMSFMVWRLNDFNLVPDSWAIEWTRSYLRTANAYTVKHGHRWPPSVTNQLVKVTEDFERDCGDIYTTQ